MNCAPGPYSIVERAYVVDRNGRKIGVAWGPHCAALFAASFEMYHALEMVRDANRSDPHIPSTALAAIDAVLAKVEGSDSPAAPGDFFNREKHDDNAS